MRPERHPGARRRCRPLPSSGKSAGRLRNLGGVRRRRHSRAHASRCGPHIVRHQAEWSQRRDWAIVRLGIGCRQARPPAGIRGRGDRTAQRARCSAGRHVRDRRWLGGGDRAWTKGPREACGSLQCASAALPEDRRMRMTGRFGRFGGCFVPEILVPALEELEAAYLDAEADASFQAELDELLSTYAGRPTPLTRCRNLGGEARIYLKREDLLHGGAHKTNQVLGQALLAKRMGKRRLIAETGAGQHGVATAMVGALFGLETHIYMGAEDVERQQLNVFRMKLMGAEVVAVENGSRTLKDAINEALRDWSASFCDTHYLLGTAAGPHPFPTMVRQFQRVIGREARAQVLEAEGRLPDAVIACVGGGSNAIGIFSAFIADQNVRLVGVEAAGGGLHSGRHGATILRGTPGILHGAETLVLQDQDGQISDTWSVSAGLDYPGVGPEHAHLKDIGRADYVGVTDAEALAAFKALATNEGILCAFESAHALAYALKLAERDPEPPLLVGLSGRGDKDVAQAQRLLEQAA